MGGAGTEAAPDTDDVAQVPFGREALAASDVGGTSEIVGVCCHATKEVASATEVGSTGETGAPQSDACNTVAIICEVGATGETGETSCSAKPELREDTGGTGGSGTSDENSPRVGMELMDRSPTKRPKEQSRPTTEAEQAKPTQAPNAHRQNGDELPIGQLVRLKGLKRKPEFNGQCGRIEAYDQPSGRYSVRVQSAVGQEMRAKLKREHFDVEPPMQHLADQGAAATVASLASCGGSRQRGDFPRNTSRPKQSSKIESDSPTTKLKHGSRNRGPIIPGAPIGVNVRSEPKIPAANDEEITAAKSAITTNSAPITLAEATPSISTVTEVVDPIKRAAAAEARAVSVGRIPATGKGGAWRPTLR